MNIEREKENPRKDYMYLEQVWPSVSFFYDELYFPMFEEKRNEAFNENIAKDVARSVLLAMKKDMRYGVTNEEWFDSMKRVAQANQFALSKKDLKVEGAKFNGMVSDVAEILRITLTGSKKSPNLHDVIEILGQEEVNKRIDFVLAKFF